MIILKILKSQKLKKHQDRNLEGQLRNAVKKAPGGARTSKLVNWKIIDFVSIKFYLPGNQPY